MSLAPSDAVAQPPIERRARRNEWRLFAAIAAADIGVKLSYMPLFSILLPARTQALDGASAPFMLSVMALAGAAVASVVNVAVGWRGDRRGSTRDRVRWLGAGMAGICAAYGLLAYARTPAGLLVAVLGLQVAVNVTISPLSVLIADRFFRRPAGFVVGAGGAAQPIASFIGAALTAALLPFGALSYLAVGALSAAMVLPFARLAGRAPSPAPAPVPGPPEPQPVSPAKPAGAGVRRRFVLDDLARLWSWRFSLALTAALSAPYALFRLREVFGANGAAGVLALTLDVSALTLLSSCAHLASAVATARAVGAGLHRRDAARLAAVVLAGAMVAFALARSGPGFVLAFGLMGVGAGLNQVADSQLALALLPSRASLGRDLGLLNLANTAPQMLAPFLALLLPGVRDGHVVLLFVLAAVSSLVGLAVAAGMKRGSLDGNAPAPAPSTGAGRA